MKITKKQKSALEKVTGRPWNSWLSESIESYFAFTDRGEHTALLDRVWRSQLPGFEFTEVEQNLWDLMRAHKFHPVSVEMWKEDFKKWLLFLSDFDDCPNAYKEHARETYDKVFLS